MFQQQWYSRTFIWASQLHEKSNENVLFTKNIYTNDARRTSLFTKELHLTCWPYELAVWPWRLTAHIVRVHKCFKNMCWNQHWRNNINNSVVKNIYKNSWIMYSTWSWKVETLIMRIQIDTLRYKTHINMYGSCGQDQKFVCRSISY